MWSRHSPVRLTQFRSQSPAWRTCSSGAPGIDSGARERQELDHDRGTEKKRLRPQRAPLDFARGRLRSTKEELNGDTNRSVTAADHNGEERTPASSFHSLVARNYSVLPA